MTEILRNKESGKTSVSVKSAFKFMPVNRRHSIKALVEKVGSSDTVYSGASQSGNGRGSRVGRNGLRAEVFACWVQGQAHFFFCPGSSRPNKSGNLGRKSIISKSLNNT